MSVSRSRQDISIPYIPPSIFLVSCIPPRFCAPSRIPPHLCWTLINTFFSSLACCHSFLCCVVIFYIGFHIVSSPSKDTLFRPHQKPDVDVDYEFVGKKLYFESPSRVKSRQRCELNYMSSSVRFQYENSTVLSRITSGWRPRYSWLCRWPCALSIDCEKNEPRILNSNMFNVNICPV